MMLQPETPQVRLRRDDILWMIGISAVMALAQLPFASYVASLPLIREEWGLTNAQAGTIYSAYQVGFALAALLLIPLTDRFPARLLFLASVWGSAITNLFFPLWATDFLSGSFLRLVAGPCLVGVYVPGIRLVSEHFVQGRRGMAVGLFVSAFYLGHSASLAVMSFLLPYFGWRNSYLISALLAFSGAALAHGLLRGMDAPSPGKPEVSGRLTLDVFRSKPMVLMIAAYASHAWELYVVRVWLAPFLTGVLIAKGMERTQAVAAAAGLAALMLAMGSPGPFLGGILSDRMGRAAAAALWLALSGAISFIIGWLAAVPWSVLLVIGMVYGFVVAADSAIYSAGVTEMADPRFMGSAQAIQTFIGFGAGVISPVVCGVVLDLFPPEMAWGLGFSTAGIAAFLGVAALLWLHCHPESSRMANGRR